MRTRITIIGLVAALAAVLALTIGPAAHADPVTELYGTCSGTTNANAEITCTFAGDGLTSSNYYVNVSLLSPSGGVVNLPANWRVTNKTTTTFRTRWFGHQLQFDPNGNIRLAIYRNGPISFDFHARVFGT
jgi:ABC-type antimicrobial peptide transport system permease subunit